MSPPPVLPQSLPDSLRPPAPRLARPFLPARDLPLSTRFYEALGFKKLFEGEVVIFSCGSGGFILQNFYVQAWAENCMMQLLVDDLDAWWDAIVPLKLESAFGVPPPRPPAMQPWGLRVAYVIDPAGVLWHVTQEH